MASIKEIFENTEELQPYQPMPLDKIRNLHAHEGVEAALFDYRGNFLTVAPVIVCRHDSASKHFPVEVSLCEVDKEILNEMRFATCIRWAVHYEIDETLDLIQSVILLERKENMEEINTTEKSYILTYGELWENIECDALPADSALGYNPKTGQYRIWYLDTSDVTVLDSEVVKQIKAL